ncbi:MAG TPA: hypothetical protein VGL56_17055 [Fimbriimonadaceae bacterium]|jgi:alpha 1,2-mannosyltransferase
MPSSIDNIREAIKDATPYPGGFEGRGVVISAGGPYLVQAYLCIRSLRRVNSELPIQVWHMGEEEMPEIMSSVLAQLNVETVDTLKFQPQPISKPFEAWAPVILENLKTRNPRGWQNKIFALANSPFEEVLYLDADNLSVSDPKFLFSLNEYRQKGCIFWPDLFGVDEGWCIKPAAWAFLGVESQVGAELESGQLLINKRQCWLPMQVVIHMNENADFYYRELTYGDKDTFRLAWTALGLSPYVVDVRPTELSHALEVKLQHAPDGSVLFQHGRKWRLPAFKNGHLRGSFLEDECLEWLGELEKSL